jgi:hypothetical protein
MFRGPRDQIEVQLPSGIADKYVPAVDTALGQWCATPGSAARGILGIDK